MIRGQKLVQTATVSAALFRDRCPVKLVVCMRQRLPSINLVVGLLWDYDPIKIEC